MNKHDLISSDYQALNALVYNKSKRSMGGAKHAAMAEKIASDISAESVLDYGCGQGQLKEKFDSYNTGIPMYEYDPAIYGKEALPAPADLVMCCDVLEHVEPEKIDNVLDHLFSLIKKRGYFVISLCETKVILADGRNAHVLLKPVDWWLEKLMAYDWDVVHSAIRIKKRKIRDLIICVTKQ